MRLQVTIAGAVWALIVAVASASAQDSDSARRETARVELTGCVSVKPDAEGQFSFVDGESGGSYRLSGKNVKKYAGQRVELVGDPPSRKRLAIRGGLWPSPNVAAQAGALDPAQESVARQPGGAASNVQARLPELKVVRMRGVDGACD